MIFKETRIPGVYLIENKLFKDSRGKFIKLFQKSLFDNQGLQFEVKENFFSISESGVIRGLHFQSPPYSQDKLIHVPKGRIMDVILDLRIKSETCGEFITVELSEENNHSIYIPRGCAHGFQSLADGSITVYSQGAEFEPSFDDGINPLSVGIKWPIADFIISDKDNSLKDFSLFSSPFNGAK